MDRKSVFSKDKKREWENDQKLSMKLLVDSVGKRVVLGKSVRTSSSSFSRSLPLSTVIRLLGKEGNLYQSVESLLDSYIQLKKSKDALLKLTTPPLSIEDVPTVNKFYTCVCSSSVSNDPRAICTNCDKLICSYMRYVNSPFVKGVVTDDLVVKPIAAISSITLLKDFNVKDVFALQEKVVNLGMNEAVKLLKVSLQSDKVLTDVFLNVKK